MKQKTLRETIYKTTKLDTRNVDTLIKVLEYEIKLAEEKIKRLEKQNKNDLVWSYTNGLKDATESCKKLVEEMLKD